MPNTKPFSELKRKTPDTPERRLQSEQRRRAIDVGLALGKLCDEHDAAQAGTAQAHLDTRSAHTSITHEEDVYLKTIRDSVEMLGGKLEINAIFPDRTVTLVPAEKPD